MLAVAKLELVLRVGWKIDSQLVDAVVVRIRHFLSGWAVEYRSGHIHAGWLSFRLLHIHLRLLCVCVRALYA